MRSWRPNSKKRLTDKDASGESFGAKAGGLLADTGFLFLEGLESIGSCASICKAPLFYLTRSVSYQKDQSKGIVWVL